MIRDGFRGVLGRDPEEEALRSYEGRFMELGLKELIRNLVGSQEHWDKLKKDNSEEIINEIYEGILGRRADESGKALFIKKLGDGLEMSKLINAVASSEEAVNGFERKYIHRNAAKSKIVFMHFWKAGGSTMLDIFRRKYGNNNVLLAYNGEIKQLTNNQLNEYRVIIGHIDSSEIGIIPGRKRVITLLRDPIKRMMSLYYFAKSHDLNKTSKKDEILVHLAQKYSITDFFKSREFSELTQFHNNYCKSLVVNNKNGEILESAILGLHGLYEFGIMEDYDTSTQMILNKLGIESNEITTPKNVLKNRVIGGELNPIEIEKETPELRYTIEKFVNYDIELYAYALTIFNQKKKMLGL